MPSDRPYVICHMTSSVDGRIRSRRWKTAPPDRHYEAVHNRLAGDAWMCGRVTMQGYADSAAPLARTPEAGAPVARTDHVARKDAASFAIALDASGRLDWGARNEIEGDHVIVALTEVVPDSHLLALQAGGQSYVFAGADTVDFPLLLGKLRALFGIERLLVEGGGGINGSMLRAGVIDELSLLVVPAVDGLRGTQAVFDIDGAEADTLGARCKLDLVASETLSGGIVWLRYRVAMV
ncbi:RibD family protein [Vineibacter terrae]|uniref:RibD family protein n=1 Tax=Vineibacter terrae TaxID=2586908 RepID=A0A5C8PPW9_9HYPH|nr:RibD family protein [Vineibacter terrae]TXL76427.1 RibD family protein [Vineibacter terrae]HEX2891983.1 RibD family protein [Vineibacter terrae]